MVREALLRLAMSKHQLVPAYLPRPLLWTRIDIRLELLTDPPWSYVVFL